MKIRRKTAVPRNAGAVLPMLACLAAQAAEGGFLEDAKTDLVLRNYYFNRDFRDHDAGKSLVDEWAQGFIRRAWRRCRARTAASAARRSAGPCCAG